MCAGMCVGGCAPGKVETVWHTGKVVDQALLEEEADDVVHAVVLGLGGGGAVEAGGGRARLHDGAYDAHHRLQAEGEREEGANTADSHLKSTLLIYMHWQKHIRRP